VNPFRKSRPKAKREKPRRKRPELFPKPKVDPWPEISRRVRDKWWNQATEYLTCAICGDEIISFYDLVPDHINPGKMGGCKDHSEKNLQPAHWWCNTIKGSKRLSRC
jgi:5-methylcytosine-specific restriction endonuclease McrA